MERRDEDAARLDIDLPEPVVVRDPGGRDMAALRTAVAQTDLSPADHAVLRQIRDHLDEVVRLAGPRAALIFAELLSEIQGRQAVPAASGRPARIIPEPPRLVALEPPPAAKPPSKPKSAGAKRPVINWIIGPPDNLGWAYGNNARRLAARLPDYRHVISSAEPADVAVYFDAIVADRYPAVAKRSVLRVGGPRPLDRLYGDDTEKLKAGLARFDCVVALSLELFRRLDRAHPRVLFIPNALDLGEWTTERRVRSSRAPFTVGYASSMKSTKEIEVKGFNVAKEAAEIAGVEFRYIEKKEGVQVANDRMIEDFYSKVDVLAHPVLPGREGTSNVIMECLACGVPVVTTTGAGLHGELLVDRKTALIRERSAKAFAEAFATLRDDKKLRQRLAAAGRAFAERHHDIGSAAAIYERTLAELTGRARLPAKPSVCFVPFWTPAEQFASSRLRAFYPAGFLGEAGWPKVELGYEAEADIAIVVQSCDEDVWRRVRANDRQFVIYDVCDRYFENPRTFKRPGGDVNSLERYNQMMDRADLVIVPTVELKAEIGSRHADKPVVYVPETIDYAPEPGDVSPISNKRVLWFGNPERGNFESSQWMIDTLRHQYGYEPIIVSRRGFFKKHPEYMPFVVDWSPEAMKQAFARAGICVLSHAPDEQTKSPNRFITAIMHGVPTVVSGSPACEDILMAEKMEFAVIDEPRKLFRAVQKLEDITKRRPFVRKLQRRFTRELGPAAIAEAYGRLFQRHAYGKTGGKPLHVGFVSHNLSVGEGAPWSLFELAQGLGRRGDVKPFAYSAGSGALKDVYETGGVPLEIFDPSVAHCVKSLNKRYSDNRDHFHDWLDRNAIDVVVCNTVKAAPYAYLAREKGRSDVVIVRESFSETERFSAFAGEARMAAEVGLSGASRIVFVAHTSREAWLNQSFQGEVVVIPNGVSPTRFGDVLSRPKEAVRRSLGIPDGDVLALCVGTVNARKGQEAIVDAFAALPKEVIARSRIVFLGAVEGAYLATFTSKLASLPEHVRGRLHLVRTNPDVAPWYRASDLFLMNSSSEAYPRSVCEGLLFGLPILSTKVFGVLEQVTDGKNGFLYEHRAMADWQRLFARLVLDPGLRAGMSAEAARSFWKLTTYPEMLNAYRALIGHAEQAARRASGALRPELRAAAE